MRNDFEILIPLVFFISVAMVIYHIIKFRNAERMAIIEKGLSEEQLSFFTKSKKSKFLAGDWTIKLAVLLIGVGLAVTIGNLVPYDYQETTTVGLIFMFPGIGLLLVYKYLEGKNKEE